MLLPEYNGAGIYKIDFGFAVYVGSSISIRKRLRGHMKAANAGSEPPALQAAFNACPNPHVDILEKLDDNSTITDLRKAEKKWIEAVATGGLNTAPVFVPDPIDFIEYCEKQIAEYNRRIEEHKKTIEREKWKYLTPISELRRGKHGNRQKETGNKRKTS